ncbi:hypothetical protein D6C84_05780 [Aureobasidium pullulans]|uniref:Uncharacterized protein n=1 Tax=Aureobasidium pullulans TaxID=5580 RepID=A0A4S9XRB3_AURPU|nr:hypothetical protein D6C84_05780 [Aureobasidium pullulans]
MLTNYHLPSEDSMTEEQKHFSEHYPLHVYFKVDKLRVPTLEEAIREYELAKAALFAHRVETSLVSGQTQALLDRCHAAKALIRHPRSWAERAYIPGAMRTTEERPHLERRLLEQRYYHNLRYFCSSTYHRISAKRFREMYYEHQKAASQPDNAFEMRIRELVASHSSSSLHARLDTKSTSTNNVFTLPFKKALTPHTPTLRY